MSGPEFFSAMVTFSWVFATSLLRFLEIYAMTRAHQL